MNRILTLSCIAVAVAATGCASTKTSTTTKTTTGRNAVIVSSSDKCDYAVYPQTTGPVDSYRPKFEVENKKVTIVGWGKTEEQATEDAILNGCQKQGCDYIAAAKKTVKKITPTFGAASYEVTIVGFPAKIVGVETIKTKFYEKQVDGTMKELPNPENRYVYDVAEGKWLVGMIPRESVPAGGDVKEDSLLSLPKSLDSLL